MTERNGSASMISQRCEHCRKEGATKRCVKCTTCFYCDRNCQTKNWKQMHKRVCSEDPAIRPHVPIEMAVERALKRLPSQETAPADATCYICLDHDSKLVRGCACRGESAGFVHLECLIELAERDEKESMGRSFSYCINCKQGFTGALRLQLVRHEWRRLRDESVESILFLVSSHLLGQVLKMYGEEDAGNRLIDAISNSSRHVGAYRKLEVAERMAEERPEEALKLAEEVLSQAKQDGDLTLTFSAQCQYMQVALRLKRYEEIVAMATEYLESVKTSCGDSSDQALIERKNRILEVLACACGKTGRFDESRRAFDELIASATRILGREHETTRRYFRHRALLSYEMVEKAEDLVFREDLADGTRYLDAVLVESKARDFFDANDPNVQINYNTMAVVAAVLGEIGRDQESLAVARSCLKSARERKDLDSETNHKCMLTYAKISYRRYGPTKESKEVLDELLAIQTRLYGLDAPQTQETLSLMFSLQH